MAVAPLSNKRLLKRWAYPMADDVHIGNSLCNLVAVTSTVKSAVMCAFASVTAAEQWSDLSLALHSAADDKTLSVQAREEAISHFQSKLISLLREARCDAVHRVLDAMVHPQPMLTESRCVIYALCSPVLSKCYVGAVGFKGPRPPIKRWREHMSLANLWNSKTSRHRFLSRRPALYTALSYAGMGNVVMVILACPPERILGTVERHFIRHLSPVYNWVASCDSEMVPAFPANLLGSATCDDVLSLAARVLRQANPKLSKTSWVSLIKGVLSAGDRSLAAKLARVARFRCSGLHSLRASYHITVHCPVPSDLLRQMKRDLRKLLLEIPVTARTPHFFVSSQCVSCKWGKSPFIESIIAPAMPSLEKIGKCNCLALAGPRIAGHLICRSWQDIPACRALNHLCGNAPLSQRSYGSIEKFSQSVKRQAMRLLRSAGMEKDDAEDAASRYSCIFEQLIQQWMESLPPMLFQQNVRKALRAVHRAGLLFVRIDRSPGRVVVLCREAWLHLQQTAFLRSHRYSMLDTTEDDSNYAERMWKSLKLLLCDYGSKLTLRKAKGTGRPYGYWTLKNKSLLLREPPIIKLRPIISHFIHPGRPLLRKIARALAILVDLASCAVRGHRANHVPMWRLHEGCRKWVEQLVARKDVVGCAESDVEDCFLNTPRELVLKALDFWMHFQFSRTRQQPFFAISKDSKKEDHRGRPCATHYWELSASEVVALVEWELRENSTFAVVGCSGARVVLQQHCGLPIGGHLSAALVELVALWREYTCEWPAALQHRASARYRDNFFVTMQGDDNGEVFSTLAKELTTLLAMPVKLEKVGSHVRCLELRLRFSSDEAVHTTVAFRTDEDRQGEDHAVTSWPPRNDPRVPLVLPSLLHGLASKLRLYYIPGTKGYTCAIRKATAFIRARGYPVNWWARSWALALVRQGAIAQCLPRLLRTALHCDFTQTPAQ